MKMIILAVVVFALIASPALAACNGSRCGCYNKYCWAYTSASATSGGDWWCYTQWLGTVGKQSNWASCVRNQDCKWEMTCGNCNAHKGEDTGNPSSILC